MDFELAAGMLAVLDLQDMPKMLDWCLLDRRDAVPSDLGRRFATLCWRMGRGLRLAGYRVAA
ncbi:hypothetical protein [Rhodoferax sp.]|uniref:hypothetical protein n=1 Tax=Rhodoferax sp. TaxID=50421 RepID=UPI00374D6199